MKKIIATFEVELISDLFGPDTLEKTPLELLQLVQDSLSNESAMDMTNKQEKVIAVRLEEN